MADGRVYSSWQPEAVVNDRIRQQENITTSWQYRQYLTNNATDIIKMNMYQACDELGLPSHFNTEATPSTNVPYTFKSTFDTNAPGFGYNNSNLKQPYLTREQLQSRMIAPTISTPTYSTNQ
jgi:hypothetical protein